MRHKILWDVDIKTDHRFPPKRPKLVIINKRVLISRKEGFTVPMNHIVRIKENEKREKYMNLARELRMLWNMTVTMIPIVIGAFETVPNVLEKRMKELEIGR